MPNNNPKEIIAGDIIRDESGKVSFAPNPNGKYKMIIERKWAFGIDPYRIKSLFQRLQYWIISKIADYIKE
jgi:hypothetical protein